MLKATSVAAVAAAVLGGAGSAEAAVAAGPRRVRAPPGAAVGEGDAVPTFQELWFNQTLDHFRFRGTPRARFPQRFLLNDDHWGSKIGTEDQDPTGASGCKGPILFYTGNEGPIDAFWGGDGFVNQYLAQELGALVIYAEERYYGKSLPFGSQSLTPNGAEYLSTEQVLADYAVLIKHLKATLPGAANCPVVAFGGSYGGTLTTYFRLRYPSVTVGGLAASAPIGYYANSGWAAHGVDAYTWTDIVNKVFGEVPMPQSKSNCLERLGAAVATVARIGGTGASGQKRLVDAFHVCDASVLGLPGHPSDFFSDAIETIPQENYPYAIGSLPAWPVNATCAIFDAVKDMSDDDAVLAAAGQVTDAYYGYTKGGDCVGGQGQGGIPGGGPGPASWGSWGYQSCTETLHQFSSHGFPHGLRDFTFNMSDSQAQCAKYFGVTIDPDWGELAFGGYAIEDSPSSSLSNTILSQGLLDPWHGGGFLTQQPWMASRNVTVLTMPQGAHHLDLRAPNPADPAQVVDTRGKEEAIIKGWIAQHFQEHLGK